MRIGGIDPRTVEVREERPRYRVYFWERIAGPHGSTSYACDENQIHDAENVLEVLDWAERNAEGRTYQVFADLLDDDGEARASIQLLGGDDPTVG